MHRPKGLVWTDERVACYRKTGERPSPVMVWTPDQTGQFLDFAAEDQMHALSTSSRFEACAGVRHAACDGKTSTSVAAC